jgi:hypothetical protein
VTDERPPAAVSLLVKVARRPLSRTVTVALGVVYVLGVAIAALLMGHGLHQGGGGKWTYAVLIAFLVAVGGVLYFGVIAITHTGAERRTMLWSTAAMAWFALAAAFVLFSAFTEVVKS